MLLLLFFAKLFKLCFSFWRFSYLLLDFTELPMDYHFSGITWYIFLIALALAKTWSLTTHHKLIEQFYFSNGLILSLKYYMF